MPNILVNLLSSYSINTITPISITTTASTTVIIICYILEWTWDPILWREFRVVLGRPVPQ